MNHERTPPQHLDIIRDSDGSLNGVIGLLHFLQHPDVSVRALTISCGQAHPEIFTPHLPRMLAQFGGAPDAPDWLKTMGPKLQAILHGAPDPALTADPDLDFDDAVELQLLLETLGGLNH